MIFIEPHEKELTLKAHNDYVWWRLFFHEHRAVKKAVYCLKSGFSLQMLRLLTPQPDSPTSSSLLTCRTAVARPTTLSLRVLHRRYRHGAMLCQNLIISSTSLALFWSFLTHRSTSLSLQRWGPWWIQAIWESRSEAFHRGVLWSTSPSPSPLAKLKPSVLWPRICYCRW